MMNKRCQIKIGNQSDHLDLLLSISRKRNHSRNSPADPLLSVLGWSARVVLFVLTFVLLPVLPNAIALNQEPHSTSKHEAPFTINPNDIELKINEVKKRLSNALAVENDQAAQRLGVTISQLQERTAKLRDLETIYQRLITALKKNTVLERDETLLREKLQSQQKIELSQNPPYSLSFYDTILGQQAAADHKKETANLEISLAKKALEDARLRMDDSQQAIRRYKEENGITETDVEPSKLNWELLQAQLELEIAQAVFDLQKVTKQNLSIEVRLATQQAEIIRKNIVWVRKNLHFDKSDLERQLKTLEKTRMELQKRLKEQLRGQMKVETAWLQAQNRLKNAKPETEIKLAKTALETADARREVSQQLLEQTEDMLDLLNQQEQAWKNRYALIKGEASSEQADEWQKEFEARKVKIERTIQLRESYQSNLQTQITTLVKLVSEQDMEIKVRRELENRLHALETLTDGSVEYLSTLKATLQMNQRLLDEIGAKRENIVLWKTITELASRFRNVWNFELWVIDEHGVTVKKLVIALFILIIGLVFVKGIVLLWIRRVLTRIQMKETTTAAVEKMFNYFTILLIILFTLHVVNIPLTLFAFLGGAIVIGVGFGAQNLINNFISGFIIMGEQPIKIGDLIEIEGTFAKVEEIGARCTRIRTSGNVHILVPNSSFLEKNIINWTLSDTVVRAQVTAGVIYGSPVREVEQIMLQVVREHKRARKRPEPFVLFNDFGNNALIFDLYFWINMERIMDRRIIESDVRFHIDELFRKAGIVIAFPQRDVHLDTQRPLELRIVNSDGRSEVKEE